MHSLVLMKRNFEGLSEIFVDRMCQITESWLLIKQFTTQNVNSKRNLMNFRSTLLVLVFPFLLQAQSNTQQPTIQINGMAQMQVMPDIGVLTIQITAKRMRFNESIGALDTKTTEVKKQLLDLDFNKKDVQTRAFHIRKNTIYDRNKRIDSGYIASQSIIVEFDFSKDRISEILSEFAEASVGMQMSFSFKISENLQLSSQEKLMALATKDAKRKATILTSGFNKALNDILSISYGASATPPQGPVIRSAMMKNDNYSPPVSGFTPEKIKLTERVYVIWTLK